VADILPKATLKLMLIANKIDFNQYRVVSKEDGESLAKEFNLSYFETSAKKATNIDISFSSLVKEILKRTQKIAPIKETKTGKLTNFLS
jgi:GTPase SAR1 family protein